MRVLEKVREICYQVATCYGVNAWPMGGIIASLLAIPLLALGRFISMIAPWSDFLQFVIFIGLSYLVIHMGLKAPEADYHVYDHEEVDIKSSPPIVYDKVVGMTIVLLGVPLDFSKWQVMAFGFALFHSLDYFRDKILTHEFFTKVGNFSQAAEILGSDVIFGLGINLVVRIFLLF